MWCHTVGLRLTFLDDFLEQLGNLILYFREEIIYLLVHGLHLLGQDWDYQLFYLRGNEALYAFFHCLANNCVHFDFLCLLTVHLLLELVHLLGEVLVLTGKFLEILDYLVLNLRYDNNPCFLLAYLLFWWRFFLLSKLFPLLFAQLWLFGAWFFLNIHEIIFLLLLFLVLRQSNLVLNLFL